MKVRVYFNLNKKLFSVQDFKTKRVIAHKDKLFLTDVEFKVYESGRQRVLRERRKNVHGYVIGNLEDKAEKLSSKVTYNPYIYDSFVYAESKAPIFKAEKALLMDKSVFV